MGASTSARTASARADDDESILYLYVVDDQRALRGVVALWPLLAKRWLAGTGEPVELDDDLEEGLSILFMALTMATASATTWPASRLFSPGTVPT